MSVGELLICILMIQLVGRDGIRRGCLNYVGIIRGEKKLVE